MVGWHQPSPWVGPGKPNLPLGLRGKALGLIAEPQKGQEVVVWGGGAVPASSRVCRLPGEWYQSMCRGRAGVRAISQGLGQKCRISSQSVPKQQPKSGPFCPNKADYEAPANQIFSICLSLFFTKNIYSGLSCRSHYPSGDPVWNWAK